MIISKITPGFVIQGFDTDTQSWVSQEFVAGDQVDYEVDGNPINVSDFEARVVGSTPYLGFDMVQPIPTIDEARRILDSLPNLEATQ